MRNEIFNLFNQIKRGKTVYFLLVMHHFGAYKIQTIKDSKLFVLTVVGKHWFIVSPAMVAWFVKASVYHSVNSAPSANGASNPAWEWYQPLSLIQENHHLHYLTFDP